MIVVASNNAMISLGSSSGKIYLWFVVEHNFTILLVLSNLCTEATLAGILNGAVLAEAATHEHLSKLLKGAEKNETLSCENMKACLNIYAVGCS